ncbi:hypothetical protein [Pseudomonas sp. SBB6]|uniref:hypothetical protein n=1 Tax=Pseudomonas sp. SBB6 TaxID=2962032 RepID=UPI0020B8ABEC|nr:hypothetical protein [Pseudomonas sp. SBB6]MCP3751626.1 hypothetical protein [Pseudomonas sp. SBB6]
MDLQFKRLSEISSADIIDLNNNPGVLRHMPLGFALMEKSRSAAHASFATGFLRARALDSNDGNG